MKVGRILIAFAVAAGGAYAAAKGYIYYKTRAALERVVASAGGFADVQYGAISSTLLTGTVRVEGVRLTVANIPDPISIRALSLRTGSLPALFNVARRAKGTEPPESLAVRIDDASVAVDGPLFQIAERLARASTAASTSAHCADQPTTGPAIIGRLGYDTITFDGEVSYRIEKRARRFELATKFEFRDMAQVTTAIVFAADNGAPRFKGPPAVKTIDIAYKDLSYKDRLMHFCTQAAKITDAEFVDAEVDHGMFYRQLGIIPGSGLRAAYREFLVTPNGEWRVHVQPNEGFDPRAAKLYRPEDILGQLNATVSVNGKPVEDLRFEFGTPAEPPVKRHAPAKTADAPTNGPPVALLSKSRTTGPAHEADSYRTVGVRELGRYIDRHVRLHQPGREPREGILKQVNPSYATVERRYQNGSVVVKVPLARIVRAEVYVSSDR